MPNDPSPSTPSTDEYAPAEVLAHRRAWTAALRSGTYAQGFGALRVSPEGDVPPSLGDDNLSVQSTFCCLGVATDLRGCRWTWEQTRHDFLKSWVAYDVFGVDDVVDDDDDAVLVRNSTNHRSDSTLTAATQRWLGLATDEPSVVFWHDAGYGSWESASLASLNDDGYDSDPWTFAQIANVIDAQPDDWDGTDAQARQRVERLHDDGVRP